MHILNKINNANKIEITKIVNLYHNHNYLYKS